MPKSKSKKQRLIVAIAMLPFLFLALQAFGQSSSSLSGTVQDASKAVLPGASITATNVETGVTTTQITNNAGIYNFPALQPGVYKVVAEMPGFQTITKTDVKLSVAGQQRLNFELPVAGVTTEVEVVSTAQDLLLESGSSTGTILQQESVTELPLVSNDVMDLVNIMGGVVKAENPIFANASQTFAGVSSGNVNIQADGVTVNEIRYSSGIVSPIRLNPEMVGEFKMILSPVDAEMGRGAGQVQVLTRSGGNAYHGSGVWNVQNTALDANEFGNNRTIPRTEPNWRNLNNYTISASGPIIKNKTFFFAVWDQQIVRTKAPYDAPVLTPCARKGIFRYLDGWINANRDFGDPVLSPASSKRRVSVNPDGTPLLENPDGGSSELRYYSVLGELSETAKAQIAQDPINCSAYDFAGLDNYGIVEGTNWDQYRATYDQSGFIERFTGMMPPANSYEVGDGLNVGAHRWTRVLHGSDTVYGSGEDNERKSITIKIDHNLSSAHRLGGTYVYESDYGEDAYATWPEEYGGYGGAVDRQPQRFTASLTSTIRPTLLNEFRVGLSRTRTHTNEPLNNPKTGDKMREVLDYLMPTDNFPNYSGYPLIVGAGAGIASFQTDTFSWFGGSNASHPYGSRNNLPSTWGGVDPRWTFADNITWIKGSHTFKGGFEARINKSWQETNGAALFVGSANTFPSVQGGMLSTSPPAMGELAAWEGMIGTDNGTSSSGNFANAYNLMTYISGSVGNIRQYFYLVDPQNPRWNNATQGELNRISELHNREFSFFFKDQWKVTSNFDLNLGLRYEYYGVPWVAGGMTAYIEDGVDGLFGISEPGFENWMPESPVIRGDSEDLLNNEYLTRQILVGPDSPNPDIGVYEKDFNNFGPAVGFAWQLPWFGRGKTTLRGGYQLSYSQIQQFDYVSGYISSVPGTTYSFQYGGDTEDYPYMDMSMLPELIPIDQFRDPLIQPLSVRPVTDRGSAINVYDSNIRSPYIQSLTLSLTRTIGSNLTVDVRYVGTLSRKQIATLNLNTSNAINNQLLEELKIVRAGGESELLNTILPSGGLCPFWFPGCDASSPSGELRTSFYTNTNLANGNLVGVANTLATSNGWLSAPSGTRGALLRATGTPENFIYTNPQFSSANLTGNYNHANYHSMQAQVTLRPTRGLSFQTTYTWSRNLGDRGWTDYRDRAADYGIVEMHRSHQLTTYGTFELPFGANGFFFRNASGWAKKAIEGWQLSWTGSVTSGLPASVTGVTTLWGGGQPDLVGPFDPKDGAVTWDPGAREGRFFGDTYVKVPDPQCANIAPQLQGICNGNSGLRALALASDPATIIFQNAEPGVRGNYSLNELNGPGRWNLDLAMSKSIEFMEGKKIDFRVDAQNIFNHPTPSNGTFAWNARFTQLYNPDFGLNNTQDFGRISSKGGHRTFQAKIRISF